AKGHGLRPWRGNAQKRRHDSARGRHLRRSVSRPDGRRAYLDGGAAINRAPDGKQIKNNHNGGATPRMYGTDEERQEAMLAFSAVFGGGVIAYTAASSARDGDFLATEAVEAAPTVGIVGLGMGLGFTALAANEAAKSVGWKPLLLGSVGVGVAALVVRAIRS